MRLRKLIATAGIATTLAGFGLATAGDASASTIKYDCSTSHTVCLYYNSSAYGYGAFYRQSVDEGNYSANTSNPDKFTAGANGSAGAGVAVKNHAAAVDSWYNGTFTVYYNSGFNCSYACQSIPSMATVDLSSVMKNNDAGGRFE